MDALLAQAAQVFTPNYAPAPIVFVRGEGPWLWDTEGRRYLDFAAGIAVCALGHGHPAVTRAVAEQARDLLHVSNLYYNEPSIRLAARLTEVSFADAVYFANSGAEANEAAMKLARRYMQLVRGEDRYGFVCAEQSFHGRTWAAISATGQPNYHQGFGPLVPGFTHVPYDDLDGVEAAIDEHTCAVLMEPIQGEGGVVVPSPGYLAGLRALCDRHGVLLIFDEVQTGIGRTGDWFAYQRDGVAPDIMTLAKGLGGGVPIGAMVCTRKVSKGFAPGAHASTFGGNALACRAALAVLDTIRDEDLVAHTRAMGAYLTRALETLGDLPGVQGVVRGRGLLQGLVVEHDRPAVRKACLDRGLLLTQAGPDAIRFSPPLLIGPAHIDEAVAILRDVLQEVHS